jgi:rSAM/selenodomain-associated transferase 1
MSKDNIILCFCKHPVPGLVKSRLAKDIGNDNAAEIYKLLLNETLNSISRLEVKAFLYCYPDTEHPTLKEYKNKFGVELKEQHGENLGMKMFHAITNHLNENSNVVLVGSDCLEINASYIQKAFEALNSGYEIVLGPAIDGGYALIGANNINVSIFENIAWSTNEVLKQTEEKINELDWKYSCLNKVRDLDTLEDFQYFSTHNDYQKFFKRLSSPMH